MGPEKSRSAVPCRCEKHSAKCSDRGSDQFLILTNSYPILCETFASEDEPLLGLYIRFDMTELLRLTQVMSEQRTPPPGTDAYATQALSSCPMTEALRAELQGLIATLHNRMESKALGASYLTRIYYEVLSLPQGGALKSLVQSDSKLARVSSAMRYMEEHLGAGRQRRPRKSPTVGGSTQRRATHVRPGRKRPLSGASVRSSPVLRGAVMRQDRSVEYTIPSNRNQRIAEVPVGWVGACRPLVKFGSAI